MKLENKVSFVTGASRGIGKQIAITLAKNGSDLALCDIDSAELEKVKLEIENSFNRKVFVQKVDVSNYSEVSEFVKKILDNLNSLDILVNNAGITRDNLIMRMTEQEWDSVLNINLKGAFNCIKAVVRPMMKKKYGKIVNMASIIGLMGNAGQCNYAASKGGLISLTKTVAKEFGSRNINVNAIAPGFIKTKMTEVLDDKAKDNLLKLVPLNRLGEVEDIANLVLFLTSSDSDYITGQVIQVDGGMVM